MSSSGTRIGLTLTNTVGGGVSGRRKNQDFAIISRYIKHDLFSLIKFVYDHKEDWKIGGEIYKNYVEVCGDSMGSRSLTDEMRSTYLQSIWRDACDIQIQNKALSQKRSAVYTVMQTKFQGTVTWVISDIHCLKTY